MPLDYEVAEPALHARFRSVLKLTQLITAINNNDHPTLHLPRTQKVYPTTPSDEVIFALATLLVRNHEIIAVAASGAGVVAMQQSMETAASEPDSASNKEPATHLPFDEYLNFSNTPLNTRRDDDHFNFPDGCCCMLVSKGKSLLRTKLKGDEVWT
jgi:hypothetical protein